MKFDLRSVPFAAIVTSAVIVSLAACDSGTDLEPNSPIKVIHAAPSQGAYDVTLDGQLVGTLAAAGQGLADTVRAGTWAVQLQGGAGDLGAEATVGEGEALGVILMEDGTVTARPYLNTRTDAESSFVIINAVPDTDLSIQMEGRRTAVEIVGLGFRDSQPFGVNNGSYDVRAVETATVDTMDLGQVQIPRGLSYVVFYPNPDGPTPWSVVAF